jgi:hypothetical protein
MRFDFDEEPQDIANPDLSSRSGAGPPPEEAEQAPPNTDSV